MGMALSNTNSTNNTSHTHPQRQASSRLFPRCPAPHPISADLDSSSAIAKGLLAMPRADPCDDRSDQW
jgi:hypothetical protein